MDVSGKLTKKVRNFKKDFPETKVAIVFDMRSVGNFFLLFFLRFYFLKL